VLPLLNRDDRPFHPHGVDLWTTATGERRLFVINHLDADSHAVEEYGVQGDALVFRRRLQDPLLRNPNDLVAAGDDEFYASNDHSWPGALSYIEGALSFPGGDLVHYRSGQWRVAVEGVAYANGVEVDAAGERFYLAAVRELRVREYLRDPATGELGTLVRSFDVGSGVDNLMWQDPRTLLVAAHPDVLAFARHAADPGQPAPSQIFALDVVDGSSRLLFGDDGGQVAAASTGWVSAGLLVMGQVFDDGLVSCPLP
jgi:arylesterase/paraoxonase